jgi:uncharacterized membrane protein
MNQKLKILGILHFIYGGLCLFGILFLLLHYTMFSAMMSNEGFFGTVQTAQQQESIKQMQEMWKVFLPIYWVLGFLMIMQASLAILSGIGFSKRKWRTLLFVTCIIDCFWIPIGTALGVFGIITLLDEEAKSKFRES